MPLDVRYRRLAYVALNVTDHARSHRFYQDMIGLQPAGTVADGEHLYRCSEHHHDLILHEAATPGLRRVAWEMESPEDLAKLRCHLARLGIAVHIMDADYCAALGLDEAFQIVEPNTGATFEYCARMVDADSAYAPTVTRIVRLGHVVLGAKHYEDTEQFFTDSLNYRISDRIDGAVTFMRCFPNPLHHSFGLSKSDSNRLHHVNFMVSDIDDIGKALYRARKFEVPVVFGPGRHPPSESIFLYFLDPDGTTLEYSFGMEEFPEVAPRPPRRLPLALESIDYWGAVPQAEFGKGGVIESRAS
jgi:2,3-dihydroxy-p-cumate/2,3-dihydroxybenzoate 3,4-dioxygenase